MTEQLTPKESLDFSKTPQKLGLREDVARVWRDAHPPKTLSSDDHLRYVKTQLRRPEFGGYQDHVLLAETAEISFQLKALRGEGTQAPQNPAPTSKTIEVKTEELTTVAELPTYACNTGERLSRQTDVDGVVCRDDELGRIAMIPALLATMQNGLFCGTKNDPSNVTTQRSTDDQRDVHFRLRDKSHGFPQRFYHDLCTFYAAAQLNGVSYRRFGNGEKLIDIRITFSKLAELQQKQTSTFSTNERKALLERLQVLKDNEVEVMQATNRLEHFRVVEDFCVSANGRELNILLSEKMSTDLLGSDPSGVRKEDIEALFRIVRGKKKNGKSYRLGGFVSYVKRQVGSMREGFVEKTTQALAHTIGIPGAGRRTAQALAREVYAYAEQAAEAVKESLFEPSNWFSKKKNRSYDDFDKFRLRVGHETHYVGCVPIRP